MITTEKVEERTMKKLVISALSIASMLSFAHCAIIPAAQGGATNMTGEAWYVRNTGIPGYFSWATSIWYCPAPAGGKPAECKEAKVIEDAAAAAKKK